jgi:RimJ/RimL family protein N-acetyltransferase
MAGHFDAFHWHGFWQVDWMTIDYLLLGEQLERVHTGRLALRAVAIADAWPLFNATRNPLFNRHLLWNQPCDDSEVLERMDAIVEASRRGRLAAVSAVVKATGEWVSLFRFQPYAADSSLCEMGVWTHDRFWHGRVSLELGRACVDAAFSLSDTPILIGAASPDNKSSSRLMELCGMTPTKAVLRQSESEVEVLLQEFAITRDTWMSRERSLAFQQIRLSDPVPGEFASILSPQWSSKPAAVPIKAGQRASGLFAPAPAQRAAASTGTIREQQ